MNKTSMDEIMQTPGSEFELLKESIKQEINCAKPGVVLAFNEKDQTATIELTIRSLMDGQSVKPPILTDVPVFFFGGQSGGIAFPVQKGDECLVVFADSCIDAWLRNGGSSSPISVRKHDLSDGFAFVGFRSRPNALTNLENHYAMTGEDRALINKTFRHIVEMINLLYQNVAELPYSADPDRRNNNAWFHNSIYRGKCLGDRLTKAQAMQIELGTFDDMFIGDYWTIGGHDWVICDFDYYYHCGTPRLAKHHIVMMPADDMLIPEGTSLYGLSDTLTLLSGETVKLKKWNENNTTEGGYKESRMRTVIMKAANTIVINAFGSSHILALAEHYPSGVSGGITTGVSWFMSSSQSSLTSMSICDLCNETMIYGQQIFGLGGSLGKVGLEVGIDRYQLAIFAKNRDFLNNTSGLWLRNTVSESSTNVTFVGTNGTAALTGAANSAKCIRPRFLLC